MVKSGLENQDDKTITPRVSPYRLAAHLGSALVLYSLFFFQGLNHIFEPYKVIPSKALLRFFYDIELMDFPI